MQHSIKQFLPLAASPPEAAASRRIRSSNSGSFLSKWKEN
jgi:hypothetical protein